VPALGGLGGGYLQQASNDDDEADKRPDPVVPVQAGFKSGQRSAIREWLAISDRQATRVHEGCQNQGQRAEDRNQEKRDRDRPAQGSGRIPGRKQAKTAEGGQVPGRREQERAIVPVEEPGDVPAIGLHLVRHPADKRVGRVVRPQLDGRQQSRRGLQRDPRCRQRVIGARDRREEDRGNQKRRARDDLGLKLSRYRRRSLGLLARGHDQRRQK
jgi:hypothetical protein